jgi:hypothetical protein
MSYSTIDKPSDYFNTVLYTGSNSTQSVTGVGFQPDLVWIKNRTSTPDHMLNDAVRTAGKQINSNTTTAELDRTYFQSFNSDGFSLEGNVSDYNQSGSNFASWNWKANGAGSANTDGSINSTVSANTTASFSIVKWVGTGSNATIGHGLGVKPAMIITKPTSAVGSWYTYHKSLDATDFIKLNSTDATADNATIWNDTEPTTSVFTTGTAFDSGRTFIAYCFAEKTGYSKFGSYTGNGNADGTFIYTGFKPAFVIIKVSSRAGFTWVMYDNKRDTFNTVGQLLQPDVSDAELTSNIIDFLSNGIKMRNNSLGTNGSGDTYIYMCFAENPFVGSNFVPNNAR